jgi:enoyl-CoA hydratase/carnithine racemase
LNVPIDEALHIEASYFARMVSTQDIREGITAWLERRKPQFTGS